MSNHFEVKYIQPRMYHARHKETGQRFELRGRQGVHYWEAHKMHKDTVDRHIYLDDWQSKKKLLEALHQKIMQDVNKTTIERKNKEARKQAWKRYWAKKYHISDKTRFRPYEYAELKKKRLKGNKVLYLAPATGERFIMQKKADGFYIWFEDDPKGQMICMGMDTEQAALLELYFYLDVPLEDHGYKDYKETCFKQI